MRWRPLLLTGIAYRLLAVALLSPIVSLAFRLFVGSSGRTVLADQDILFFFVSPVGSICLITVGGLWLAIVALEQAALLHVLYHRQSTGVTRTLEAIGFAISHSGVVLNLTLRLVARSLLIASPFLAAAGVVYRLLLNQYDINYYLSERPPAFGLAVACGCLLSITLAVVLLRLLSSWVFALPVLLFTNRNVKQSLQASQAMAAGRRVGLVSWLAAWGVGTVLVSAFLSGTAGILGQFLLWNTPAHLETRALGPR